MDARIDRDRLSVVTGGLLLALGLARLLEVSPRSFQVSVFGSPLGFDLSVNTILLLIMGGMAVTGVESLVRAHPLLRQDSRRHTVVYWIVPALLSVALASWLSRFTNLGYWIVGMTGAALLIPLALAAEYAAVAPQLRRDTWLQWAYSVLIHLVGLLLFSALYDARLRGLVGAPIAFAGATLLAARLFWAQVDETRQVILYGIVTGLLLSQSLLVLNYWPLSNLQGGLALLLVFYLLVALLQRVLTLGRLERRFVLEYGGVALLALLLLLVAAS
jgi:hypothetical protein